MANGNNKPHRTRTTEPNTVSTRTEPPPIDPREPCRRPSRNDPTKPHQRNPTRTTPHRTHCLKRNPSARIKKIGCWDQRWEAGRSRSRRKAGKFRVGGISRLSAQAGPRDQAAATVPRDQGPGLQPGFKILPVLRTWILANRVHVCFWSRFARIHVLKTGLPGSSGRNPLKIAQPHLVAKKSSDGRSARLRGSTLARKPRPVKSCPTSRQKPKERETVQTGANLNPEVVSSVECFCLDKKTTLANKSKFKKSHGGLSVRPPRTRRHAHRSPLSPLTPCPPPCT